MAMTKANNVIQDLCSGNEPPCFLVIIADDPLRAERVLQKIFADAYKDHKIIDAQNLKEKEWQAIEVDLLSVSLFATPKVIVVRNAHKLVKAMTERLAQAAETLSPGTHLVVCGNKFPKENPLRKRAQKLKCLVDLPPFKADELLKWTKNELARNRLTKVPHSVINSIIKQADGSPAAIADICEHCSLYVDGDELSEAAYEQLFLEQAELKDYGLLDALQARQKAQAKLLCTQLIRQGRSPFILLAMIARNYQQYAKFIGLKMQGRTDDEVVHELKLQPWLLKKLQIGARGISTHRLHKAFHAIFEADLRLKDKSLGDEAIMSELVDRLCA
ncbi:MAG: DNA polymerase III subunit delta [Bdellovibrionales bacterium]|nr:DNA polymerase III subunit delta [Bdellovibrionales bacterium]